MSPVSWRDVYELVERVGERMDARFSELEKKLDIRFGAVSEDLDDMEGRVRTIEIVHGRSEGADNARAGIFRFTRATVAIVISIAGMVIAILKS